MEYTSSRAQLLDGCLLRGVYKIRSTLNLLYIIGEVRGAEAADLVGSALNCGHDGSMSTGHANNAEDMLHRLSTLEEPQKCVSCPDRGFCRACPGRRCAETGMPDGIPMRYCVEARQQHLMYTRYTSNVEVKE